MVSGHDEEQDPGQGLAIARRDLRILFGVHLGASGAFRSSRVLVIPT